MATENADATRNGRSRPDGRRDRATADEGRTPLRRLRRVPGRGEGARGRRGDRLVLARGLRREAREAARGLGHGPRRRDHRQDDRVARRGARGRRHDHRRRQHPLPRRHPARQRAPGEGHPPRRRRHERRRVGLRARLLPHDRRRGGDRGAPQPDLRLGRPGRRRRASERRAGRAIRAPPSRAGTAAARTARATS